MARGHEVELSCLAAKREIPRVALDLHPKWPISTSHARVLRRIPVHVDIAHNHNLWSMVNVASGWVGPGQYAKLVTSPHGTLSRWVLRRTRLLRCILQSLQR